MSKKSNQRADVFNPNNPAHKAAQDNTSNQKNPNHAPTKPDVVKTETTSDPKKK